MRSLAALLTALLGAALVLLAAAPAPRPRAQAPAGGLPYRAVAPALAADSAPGLATLPAGTPTPTATLPPASACGYRAAVRALADPAAAAVDRTPAASSVTGLLALDRPPGLTPASPRQLPSEGRAVQLTAWLRGAIRTPDGGIDLLISTSPDGPLLRARFPGPGCTEGASEADRAAIEAARIAFINRCGVPTAGSWRPLGGQAVLVGVPAWGEPRPSGTDGAPTGIELAPVLDFAMPQGATCDPNQPFGPTPTPTPGAALEMLINVNPIRVSRGGQVTVTIIVQEPPPPGGTPIPGPAGIPCSYTAYDRALAPIASGGPSPTGPGGTVSWTFTVPPDAALSDYSTNTHGRVTPACQGLTARGSARLEILE